MRQYVDMIRHVLEHGEEKASRAILSDGTKPKTRSVFGYQYRHNLAEGFPLLTSKKINFRHVATELVWFLRGDTNVAYLRENGVKIWDKWADDRGELGPIYGKQWRRWECPDGRCVDQIGEVLQGIDQVMADPEASQARRLVVSAWNAADQYGQEKVYGPLACHTLFQFMVSGDKLSCHLYQRSADLFLGVPWNIASYALLTHLVAKINGLRAHEFIHSFGDAHIYWNHLDQARSLINRELRPLPNLKLDVAIRDLDTLSPDQFDVINYDPHPFLPGEVAV